MMPIARRPGLSCVFATCCLVAGALPGSAVAQKDYDPKNRGWNGLSYLSETAEEARVSLEFIREVDWTTVQSSDVLVFLFPQSPLPHDNIRQFVADGGSIVVLDDFGASADLLEEFGILRLAGRPEHRDFYQKDQDFPEFTPTSDHFLFYNIVGAGSTIIANHPGRYRVQAPAQPLLSYNGGTGQDVFLAESRVGKGGVVALADGSLVINDMLKKHGNKQLVANLLRYFCTADPCVTHVILPTAEHVGRYVTADSDALGVDAFFLRAADAVNAGIFRISESFARRSVVRFTLFVSLLILFAVFLAWAPQSRKPQRMAWETDLPDTPPEAELNAAGLLGAKEIADFSQPAMMLKTLIEQVVFGADTPRYATPAERTEMADQYIFLHRPDTRRKQEELRTALLQVFEFFHTLQTARSTSFAAGGYITVYSQFESIKAACQKILDAGHMSEPDDWSRAFSRTPGSGRFHAPGRF